jgi:transposase
MNLPDREPYERLLKTLRAHSDRESAVLDAYRHLVEGSDDEGVRYLGRLIMHDEERHHEVINEMANRVESWMQGVDVEPSTPALSPHVDRELLDETRRLIELEHEDAKELRQLRHELHDAPPSSLLPFLVTLMIHDTETHIEILRFIHAHTG